MGIIFGLLSSLLFAFAYIALKKSTKEFPSSVGFFFDMLFGLLIWVPFSILSGLNISEIITVFPYAFLSAILSEAFFFYILSKGEISITGTVLASYPIFTILFSNLILKERLTLSQNIFVLLVILGILLLSLPKEFSKADLKKKSYILWALLGAVVTGFSDTISKKSIDATTASSFLFALALCQIPISLIFLRSEKQSFTFLKDFFKNVNIYIYIRYFQDYLMF